MISQQQVQKQQLKILPQQIQLLNLFFLNSIELEQRILNELEENPFLDQEADNDKELDTKQGDDAKEFQDYDEYMYDDVPDYKEEYRNYFDAAQTPDIPIRNVVHFKDEAKQQLRLLDIEE